MNTVQRIVEQTLKRYEQGRFTRGAIIEESLNNPEIRKELRQSRKSSLNFPYPELCRAGVEKYTDVRIRSSYTRIKIRKGKYVNLRKYWSTPMKQGNKRIYARTDILTLQEIREAGYKYIRLGEANMAKGKLLVTAADKAQQEKRLKVSEEILREAAEELARKGEIT